MALTFDFAAQRIRVTAPQTAVDMQSLINAVREAESSEQGIAYDQIADASGKDDLGGGIRTAITVALRAGWALEFYPGNYTATVDGGNLVAASGDPVAHVAGGPQIEITRSAAATVVETTGSAAAAGIAQAVWDFLLSGANPGSAGDKLKQALTTGNFLALK